jgi:hypothetical protein
MIAAIVYVLCALTSAACAALLLRGYKRSAARLLLWSGLCFTGLALNNVLLFVDKVILPTAIDLTLVRSAVALAALSVLVYGMIWEAD